MSWPHQWTFNAAVVLFMLIVLPIAFVIGTLALGKARVLEAMAPAFHRTSSDAQSLAESVHGRPRQRR